MNKFTKQDSEKYGQTIDFSNTLSEGETIASFEITVTDHLENEVPVSEIIESSTSDTDSVTFVAKDGENETIYKITIIITSNVGYIYEEDIYMEVLNI